MRKDKKIIVVLMTICLILTMSLVLTGCGSKGTDLSPDDIFVDEEGNFVDEEGNPLNLTEEEKEELGLNEFDWGLDEGNSLNEEELQEEADLGLTVDETYPMSVLVEKSDESDLKGHLKPMENLIKKTVESYLEGDFETESDYEPADEDNMSEFLSVSANQDGNPDKVWISSGIYQDETGYVYFSQYMSDSIYTVSDIDIEKAIGEIETLYGLHVDKEKIKAGCERAFEKARDNEYEYNIIANAEKEYEGFSEQILLDICAFNYGEDTDEYCLFICAERDRIY